MKTMRCFLAIKLSLETAENITLSQKVLKKRCNEAGMGVRWVPPPNIHMTVLFLGEITEPMASAIRDMLEPIVGGVETFELTAQGMGAFPDITHPRVIWAGLGEGADKLTSLHSSVRNRLGIAGFNFDNKPFAAHITVGRVKSGPPGALANCFGEDAGRFFGTSHIRELHCFRSDLSSAGAEYISLWALPFQKVTLKYARQVGPDKSRDEIGDTQEPAESTETVTNPEESDDKGDN
jgi:2'-5' RNA ligase